MATNESIVRVVTDLPTAAHGPVVQAYLNVSSLWVISADAVVNIRDDVFCSKRHGQPDGENVQNKATVKDAS
jgi:hypothetical protein